MALAMMSQFHFNLAVLKDATEKSKKLAPHKHEDDVSIDQPVDPQETSNVIRCAANIRRSSMLFPETLAELNETGLLQVPKSCNRVQMQHKGKDAIDHAVDARETVRCAANVRRNSMISQNILAELKGTGLIQGPMAISCAPMRSRIRRNSLTASRDRTA